MDTRYVSKRPTTMCLAKKKKKCTVGASRIGGYISPECAFWFIYGAQVCVMHVAGCITPYTYGRIWWEQHSLACSCNTGMCVMPVADVSLHTAGAAMSTGAAMPHRFMVLKWYKCVCVCVDGMNLMYTLRWHIHTSVYSVLCQCYTQAHAHTHSQTIWG